MDGTMETLPQLINNMSQEDYVVAGIVIVLALFLIHIYKNMKLKENFLILLFNIGKICEQYFIQNCDENLQNK